MSEQVTDLVDGVLNKVRAFRDNTISKDKFIKQLLNDPSSVPKKDIQENVKESSLILKDMFDLINELDIIEGKNGQSRN